MPSAAVAAVATHFMPLMVSSAAASMSANDRWSSTTRMVVVVVSTCCGWCVSAKAIVWLMERQAPWFGFRLSYLLLPSGPRPTHTVCNNRPGPVYRG